jgi:squalene synthase HpnC
LSKNQRIITTVAVRHYENFPVASLILPATLRAPVEAIYRFARSADDLADEGRDPPDIRLERLNNYRAALAAIERGEPQRDPLFRDLEKVIAAHGLPIAPFQDLIDAFSQDVTKKRYASFAELAEYCRRSANPVGRLLLVLFKRTTAQDLAASDAICSALQLINFWQDVDIDYTRDRRIYLPQDEMARHGVTESHLAERRCDRAWQELMAFQVNRARQMMLAGAPLGRTLPGRIGLEIRATVQGGLRILDKIAAAGYDVFRRRPVLGAFDWPVLLVRAL